MVNENKKILFSIIMPVYNVEKYLKKAIESVLNQNCNNFELILINDCSTDSSLNICKNYLKKHDNIIKLISLKKNQGLSNARNLGIEKAICKYILFLDSDDWWDKNLLSEIYKIIKKHSNIDLVFFGYSDEWFDKNGKKFASKVLVPSKGEYLDKKSLIEKTVQIQEFNNDLFAWVANKAYRSDVLKQSVNFNKMPLSEDLEFMVRLLYKTNSLVTIDKALLHYRRRPFGSLRSKYQEEFYEIHRKILENRYNQICKYNLLETASGMLVREYLKITFLNLQMSFYPNSCKSHNYRKDFLLKIYNDKLWIDINTKFSKNNFNLKYKFMKYLIDKKLYQLSISLGFFIYFVKKNYFYLWSKMR